MIAYDGAMPDYAELADYLAAQEAELVTLSFPEVEVLIGGPLPLAAWLLADWWTGPGQPPHGAPWAVVGWRVEVADPHAGTVSFACDDRPADG
jgi:hypothetical protein